MANKQTRRSISVSGAAYDALAAWCEGRGVSMSGEVERMVRELVGMEARGVVVPFKKKAQYDHMQEGRDTAPRRDRKPPAEVDQTISIAKVEKKTLQEHVAPPSAQVLARSEEVKKPADAPLPSPPKRIDEAKNKDHSDSQLSTRHTSKASQEQLSIARKIFTF
jgi:hypothetical protein